MIWRRISDDASLDKVEEFRWDVGAGDHMPEDQGLQLKLLPL